MKTKVVVTDITHEDLVDLFSTALYGSSWLGCEWCIDNNAKEVKFKESDTCFEDKVARCLLDGKKVELLDRYSEDEDDHYNSAIEHYWDEDAECMCYKISLSDIENCLSRILSSQGWPAKYVMALVNKDDGDFDQIGAESIIQHLLWKQETYG